MMLQNGCPEVLPEDENNSDLKWCNYLLYEMDEPTNSDDQKLEAESIFTEVKNFDFYLPEMFFSRETVPSRMPVPTAPPPRVVKVGSNAGNARLVGKVAANDQPARMIYQHRVSQLQPPPHLVRTKENLKYTLNSNF